jgi:lipopolysaccharide export LptBFGC system permease protein LptF
LSDKETSSIEKTSKVLVEKDEQANSPDLVARLMMSSFSQTSNPLAEKLTENHIDKVLDNSEKDSEREFELDKLELKDQQSSKWFFLAIFIISLIFIGFIIVYLSNVDKETMRFVLGIIVGFIGGFGAKGLLPQSKKKSD